MLLPWVASNVDYAMMSCIAYTCLPSQHLQRLYTRIGFHPQQLAPWWNEAHSILNRRPMPTPSHLVERLLLSEVLTHILHTSALKFTSSCHWDVHYSTLWDDVCKTGLCSLIQLDFQLRVTEVNVSPSLLTSSYHFSFLLVFHQRTYTQNNMERLQRLFGSAAAGLGQVCIHPLLTKPKATSSRLYSSFFYSPSCPIGNATWHGYAYCRQCWDGVHFISCSFKGRLFISMPPPDVP